MFVESGGQKSGEGLESWTGALFFSFFFPNIVLFMLITIHADGVKCIFFCFFVLINHFLLEDRVVGSIIGIMKFHFVNRGPTYLI